VVVRWRSPGDRENSKVAGAASGIRLRERDHGISVQGQKLGKGGMIEVGRRNSLRDTGCSEAGGQNLVEVPEGAGGKSATEQKVIAGRQAGAFTLEVGA
jgi:hypothetical protein